MAELTADDFRAAKVRGAARMRGPRAESAYYEATRDRIVIRLTTGIEIGFQPGGIEGLQNATADDLAAVEVQELGLGLHFPTLDADLYVPALLEGVLGSTGGWRLGSARPVDAPALPPRPPHRAKTANVAVVRAASQADCSGTAAMTAIIAVP